MYLDKIQTIRKDIFWRNSHMKNKSTVRVCEDYVVRDQEEVQKILKHVSQIISKSYIRRMNEKCESVKMAVI
jgi:hypothetical protein